MKTSCPKCATANETSPGNPAHCKRCGHWWLPEGLLDDDLLDEGMDGPPPDPDSLSELATMVATPKLATDMPELRDLLSEGPRRPAPDGGATPAQPVEFELQFAVGDAIQGPFDRVTLREMLFTGRLTGDERVRVPGSSSFEKLSKRPEMAGVMALLDKQSGNAGRQSSIGGWKSAGAPVSPDAPTTPDTERARPAEPAPKPTPAAEPSRKTVAQPVSPSSRGMSTPMVVGIAVLLLLAAVAVYTIIQAIPG